MRLRRLSGPGLALVGLVVCSTAVRILTNHSFQGPQLLCDEYIYADADVARRFAATGHLGPGSGFGSSGFGGGLTGGGSLSTRS